MHRLLVCAAFALAACGGDSSHADMGRGDAPACTTDVECDDHVYCNGTETCLPSAPGADARGCVALSTPCSAGRLCDETMRRCLTACSTSGDADTDGHRAMECGGDDCDDGNPSRYPGNTEVCDASDADEDCDPTTFGVRDADHDGYPDAACCNTSPSGTMACGTDCDDTLDAVHPAQPDACNGRDDDCDGMIDEDGSAGTFYPDCDGDGYGATGSTAFSGCAPTSPPTDCMGAATAAWAANATDCDDHRSGTHPTSSEVCDGFDDDCNGILDGAGEDDDGDGHADAACGGDDCDDTCATCFPGGGPELCDGHDQDCNAAVDDGVDPSAETTYYRDADGDGVGDTATTMLGCVLPAGWVTVGGDCDDAEPLTGACVAPLVCTSDHVCGCHGSIQNNLTLLDIDYGTTSDPGTPSGGWDIEDMNGAFANQYLAVSTGARFRHLTGVRFVTTDASYETGVAGTGTDTAIWTTDAVFVIHANSGYYKIGFGVYDATNHMNFSYAPIGAIPAGFACQH